MFSSIFFTLSRHFPDIEKNIDLSKENLDDYVKFAIVRNPYTRFVSLYFDKCVVDPKNKLKLKSGIFLQPSQAQILEAYNKLKHTHHPIALAWTDLTHKPMEMKKCRANFRLLQKISFPEFAEIAEVIMSFKNPDPHFKPQCPHLFKGKKLIPDFVYKMEDIKQTWPKICKMLNKEMKLSWDNKTKSKKNVTTCLNDRNLKLRIFKLYREDFKKFKYRS